MKNLTIQLLITFAFIMQSYPRIFYVDNTTGDDNSTGSYSTPWRTITFANQNVMPGDTILIREGIYPGQIRPNR